MADAMTDHFSLAHFTRALEGFQPPTEPFDPAGLWMNAYDIVECSQGMRAVGALRIAREPVGEGECTLRIEHSKRAAGGSLKCDAELVCATDDLATPKRWTIETVSLDTDGQAIEDTRLAESGEVAGGVLRVRTGDKTREIGVEAPFAFAWGLFEAVQRRGVDSGALGFTLVDRLSYEIKEGHTLAYRKSAEVELGGRRVWREEKQELEVGTLYRPVPAREGAVATKMRALEQTGEGILPIVYWVTEQGRLLLALSGLIGYVFNAEAPV